MRRVFPLALALCLLLACAAWAEPPADGEKLVRQLWQTTAAKLWPQKAGMISPAFQSVHSFGARGKAEELDLLSKVDFGKFELSGFRTTQQGPVVVVTYLGKVEEMINGMRVDGKTAARMSVFIRTDKGWQWLAHANLSPIP
ncbi:MAG: nuclear transport factor 2 family protein [Proteobacteria bacterium]|nr:nuclear transport factor 2 family protein [Pseudomonadota bacterium]MBU1452315.1 nuclear transport factor 2 family protein [Pseudomonadota bacterium]MBU2468445.1 nuclear transport factor 2 family protein [Pseudomonadota bacterium]MBU2517907.1 nuclear transport factor 2 family protein [Pseudomonadota bacterium]